MENNAPATVKKWCSGKSTAMRFQKCSYSYCYAKCHYHCEQIIWVKCTCQFWKIVKIKNAHTDSEKFKSHCQRNEHQAWEKMSASAEMWTSHSVKKVIVLLKKIIEAIVKNDDLNLKNKERMSVMLKVGGGVTSLKLR